MQVLSIQSHLYHNQNVSTIKDAFVLILGSGASKSLQDKVKDDIEKNDINEESHGEEKSERKVTLE